MKLINRRQPLCFCRTKYVGHRCYSDIYFWIPKVLRKTTWCERTAAGVKSAPPQMSDDQRALSLLPTYRLLCPPLNTLLTISALSHMKQIQQEAKNRLFSERISTIPLFPQQTLPGRGAETLRTPPRQCGVKLRLPAATERGGGCEASACIKRGFPNSGWWNLGGRPWASTGP